MAGKQSERLFSMAKMSGKRKALEAMLMTLRSAAMARIKIMPWEISWFPTFACNLRCDYCNSIKDKSESADPRKAVDEIVRLAPASISILGGEPFIVPGMIDYLEELRERLPNLFILLTTNGMIKTEILTRAMSYVSSMCVSMDGMGDHTRKQREGADPDVILENIKACAEERRRLSSGVDLVVNSVVTQGNAMHLLDFYRIIHDMDPTILSFSQAMQPFDSPLSIGTNPKLANHFLREVAEMKKEMRILLAGRLADGALLESDKKEEIEEEEVHTRFGDYVHTCYQERFNSFLSPSGKIYTCRRYAGINGARMGMMDHIRDGRPFHAMGVYAKRWTEFLLLNPTFECVRFCGCPEWMNKIMLATCEEDLPEEISRVRGRLSEERVRESGKFIRKHVNPEFQDSFILPSEEDQVSQSASTPNCKYG